MEITSPQKVAVLFSGLFLLFVASCAAELPASTSVQPKPRAVQLVSGVDVVSPLRREASRTRPEDRSTTYGWNLGAHLQGSKRISISFLVEGGFANESASLENEWAIFDPAAIANIKTDLAGFTVSLIAIPGMSQESLRQSHKLSVGGEVAYGTKFPHTKLGLRVAALTLGSEYGEYFDKDGQPTLLKDMHRFEAAARMPFLGIAALGLKTSWRRSHTLQGEPNNSRKHLASIWVLIPVEKSQSEVTLALSVAQVNKVFRESGKRSTFLDLDDHGKSQIGLAVGIMLL